jgi:uncharacterized membrane protein YoaK (UPF0700 family)
VIALAGFVCGAAIGGSLTRRIDRSKLLGRIVPIEAGLFIGALLIAAGTGQPLPGLAQDAMAGLLAVALGLQNTMVRRLAVADLTTTVLTMALTGVAADPRDTDGQARTRRLLSIVAMLIGSVTGAALVLHGQIVAALAMAVALLLVVAVAGTRALR